MKCKKAFSLLLALLMLISVTTACSKAEWGYFNLSKEISQLERYATVGEFDINIDEIDSGGEVYKKLFDKYSFMYEIKVDMKNFIIDCDYYAKDKANGHIISVMNLKCDGNNYYVKLDGFINLIADFTDIEESNNLSEIMGDAEYISCSKEELTELLVLAYGDDDLAEQMTSLYFNFGTSAKQNSKYLMLIEDAMKNVYDNYETGLIKQNGNKYSFSLTAEEALPVLISFVNYSIDNIEKLGPTLKSAIDIFINPLFTALGIRSEDLNLKDGVDIIVTEIGANKEEFKEQFNEMFALNEKELKAVMGNSKIDYTLEKTSDNKYNQTINLVLNFNDRDTNFAIFKGKIKANTSTYAINPFSVEIPEEKTISVNALMKELGIDPDIYFATDFTGKSVTIDLDSGFAFSGSGFNETVVNVKIINGASYLPLRAVGELLGEDVMWDNDKKQPYIVKNGNSIYLNAKVIGNASYVPMRELEKVGYTVYWEAQTNMVKIF